MNRGSTLRNGRRPTGVELAITPLRRPVYGARVPKVSRQSDRDPPFLLELFRTTDAAAAVIVLLGVLVATNYVYGMSEGLEVFLRLRLTVKNLVILTCLAILWPSIFSMFGLYQAERLQSRREEIVGVVAGCSLGTVFAFVVPLTSVSGAFTTTSLAYFWAASIGTTLGLRYVIRRASAVPSMREAHNVLIVGSGPRAHRVFSDLARTPGEYNVVGFVDTNPEISFEEIKGRLLGPFEALEGILMRNVIDEVLITAAACLLRRV